MEDEEALDAFDLDDLEDGLSLLTTEGFESVGDGNAEYDDAADEQDEDIGGDEDQHIGEEEDEQLLVEEEEYEGYEQVDGEPEDEDEDDEHQQQEQTGFEYVLSAPFVVQPRAHILSARKVIQLKDGSFVSCSQSDGIHHFSKDGTHISQWLGSFLCIAELSCGLIAGGNIDAPSNSIELWNIDSGECVGTLSGHYSGVFCLVELRDGKTLASGSR